MSNFKENGSLYLGADDCRDFLFSVSAGFLSGYRQVRMYGFNPDLDSVLSEYVWDVGVEPIYDTSNTSLYAVSTNALDSQEIMIYGLQQDVNGNWNEISTTVQLNGVTPVLINNQFVRVLKVSNNNGTTLAGNVYITKANKLPLLDTDINIRAKINVGEDSTLMAMYTVPSGHTAFIYRLYRGVRKNEDAVFNYQSREFGKVFKSIGKVSSYQASEQLAIGFERLEEKSDFRVKCITTTNNTEASASVHMILVENSKLGTS